MFASACLSGGRGRKAGILFVCVWLLHFINTSDALDFFRSWQQKSSSQSCCDVSRSSHCQQQSSEIVPRRDPPNAGLILHMYLFFIFRCTNCNSRLQPVLHVAFCLSCSEAQGVSDAVVFCWDADGPPAVLKPANLQRCK